MCQVVTDVQAVELLARIRKITTVNGVVTNTYYPSRYYHAASDGSAIRSYFFGNMRIAERQGSGSTPVIYRHGDQVDSTIYTHYNSHKTGRHYTAYGDNRGGLVDTYYTYAGQYEDGTGLVYMKARYYDPNIGLFISPDSIIPDPSNVLDYNRYLYARGNPVNNNDPTGHCPKPPEGYATAICVAGFIPTRESEGAPGGVIIYEADNRDFSNDSTGQSSRFYVWIDAETGEFIGDPKDNVHPTVQLRPPQQWLGGGEHQPRDSHNQFFVEKLDDGSLYFRYSVVCAGPNCLYAPGPEGEIYFKPNDSGSFDIVGSVEGFPNLEAYQWSNGELVTPHLFQLQNFSQEELDSGRASFFTGLRMYDWWPTGHRDFESQAHPYD